MAVRSTVTEMAAGLVFELGLVLSRSTLMDLSRIKLRLFILKVINVRIHLRVKIPLTIQEESSHGL